MNPELAAQDSVDPRRRVRTINASGEQIRRWTENLALAALGAAYAAAYDANRAAEPCDWDRSRAELDRTLDALLEGFGYRGLGIRDEPEG